MDTDETPPQLRGSLRAAGQRVGSARRSGGDTALGVPGRGDDHRVLLDRRIAKCRTEFGLVDVLVGGHAGDHRDVDDARAHVGRAHHGAGQAGHVGRRAGLDDVGTGGARGEPRGVLPDRDQPGLGCRTGEAVRSGLAGDEARHRGAVAVTVGQTVGGLDEVPAALDMGQPRPRLHSGVDHRHGLALPAALLPRTGEVERQLVRIDRAGIAARHDPGGGAFRAFGHRLHRTGTACRRGDLRVDLGRADGARRRGADQQHQTGCGQNSQALVDHRFITCRERG